MTHTRAAAPADMQERAHNLAMWLQMHSRAITIVAIVLVLAAGGGWFYAKSRQVQARNAAAMLSDAELAITTGNDALAQSSLERITERYSGTRSADQARLLLAQILFDKGQFQQGMDNLQKLTGRGDRYLRMNAYNLMGAGEEQAGRHAEAAAAYRKAADVAVTPAERDGFLASSGRALMAGGKNDEAKEIWSKLAQDIGSPLSAEAKVRLGEIEATKVASRE